jgi:hypothetical protein
LTRNEKFAWRFGDNDQCPVNGSHAYVILTLVILGVIGICAGMMVCFEKKRRGSSSPYEPLETRDDDSFAPHEMGKLLSSRQYPDDSDDDTL